MNGTTLVLGATGVVGGQVVAGLARRGVRVRAATRDPRGRGGVEVEWTELDLERPETFAPALRGVERVFLIARPGDEAPHEAAAPLVEEMRRAGTRHVVNLTALGVETRNDITLRRVEELLEGSGMAWTHLRPNFFMQVLSGPPLLPAIRATGAIRIPAGDARISYIDARDIAAVAVAALTEPGHAGRAYALTGGESLRGDEVAEVLSRAAGRAIGYVAASEDEARAAITGAGLSAARTERLLGFYRLIREGFCAPVSDEVERVLGRASTPLARFAADHAACWN